MKRWWRRLTSVSRRVPLRVKLVLLMSCLVTGALVATGVAASTAMRHYLMNRVDSQLATAAGQIGHEVAGGPGGPGGPGGAAGGGGAADSDADATSCAPANSTTDATADSTSANPRLPSAYLVQISDASGTPTGRDSNPLNRNDCGPALPKLDVAQVAARANEPFSVPSRNGDGSWRVLVSVLPDGAGSVAVATPLSDVKSTLDQLALFELTIGAAVLLVLAALGYVAVRRSLRPLVDVEHTAAAIAAGDLTRRIPDADPRTEVGKLSLALNGMLSQIETAFRARETSEQEARTSEGRMRRFITDASHELRTPLTSIRGFAELYRLGGVRGDADVEKVMGRIENESRRMGLLVDDLLLLARLDQQRPLEREVVDLATIAADAVHDAGAVAPHRDVRLDIVATDRPALVVGDDSRLRQIVGNLMTNALTHTPDTASITVRVDVQEGTTDDEPDGGPWAVLEVADTGPGLGPDDAQRVFERFYRVDGSRSRTQGGSGLGLSIVAALTAAHGGRVDVSTEPGRGSTFRLRLPLATTEQPADAS
jgi:two-component system OmpR family sensor kinase